ncbi:MAG: type I-E CRISPR-associated protein Cas7/Cse4/CasC [Sulfobacillus acidophilus]|uniref:Type I-E CRISPR-associated protein Cas7/Cse4/CasC n=1 Tax=Sulfobacillus acidophilus TaxID=53633 RepID=A0A2T2WE25_9FIRM|nr:MAG: type I-E CRISPR-associated protein Cas7/Cse4/CasC [Sulfobacillus acidophilus]
MFLQVHYLTSYHASLLNRDDAGLAKRITFGGVPRLRVSSQSQKRHWREWMTAHTELSSGWRTRNFFGRILLPRVINSGIESDQAHRLVYVLATKVLHAAGDNTAVAADTLMMKQPVLFGEPEARYFTQMIVDAARAEEAEEVLAARIDREKQNLAAMLRQNGLHDPAAGFEGALFGRFVTSDILARVDAPVHVAHAFTTHALETEVDYFTVVDDLSREDETGAAHANDMELGAGIFYGYAVVDVPLLVSNLTGCDRKAWQFQEWGGPRALLNLLIHAMAEVTPGAKLGATAPYARAQCVVLEVGTTQPRSLANAFLKPIRPGISGNDPMAQSIEALARHLTALEQMYGNETEKRWVASMLPWPRDERPVPLQQAVDAALAAIGGLGA